MSRENQNPYDPYPYFDPFLQHPSLEENQNINFYTHQEMNNNYEHFTCYNDFMHQESGAKAVNHVHNSSDGLNSLLRVQHSSVSSSSTVVVGEEDSGKSVVDDDEDEKAKKVMNDKEKKQKGEKRVKEPRFAFATKSEIDQLEDGYRWRKYGQKAVKDSPFPRSYYRCTTQKCIVKKRVERSFQDPSTVITTYEGKHNHYSPATLRGNAAAILSANAALFTSPSTVTAAAYNFPNHDHLLSTIHSNSDNTDQYQSGNHHNSRGVSSEFRLLDDLVKHQPSTGNKREDQP